jgi:type II restriction enzyme
VNLSMPIDLAAAYKSRAQIARVVSEAWGATNLYCPNCTATSLNPAAANTQVYDYSCAGCSQRFQLKCMSSPIGNRILDAAYEAMLRAINEDRTPNLLALHYDRASWTVRNLILIPHFAFSSSAIEARPPLRSGARRAGWIGCFIVLEKIPVDARIHLITEGLVVPAGLVRQSYSRILALRAVPPTQRGWALDVLRIVRGLGKREFTNADVYRFVPELARLHPDNRHIRDKIRQQLQFLRDRGVLTQIAQGVWAI